MGELIPSNSSTPPPHFISPPSVPRAMPAREDCWSEDATFTLIEAWGQRYLDLNRGNLRQKQWQEVADTVNARHGHIKKARRTDVQCKNRIDTLKKKYKIEKARVLETNGSYKSPWPFFDPLDHLIGNLNAVVKKLSASPSQSPPLGVPIHHHHLARNNAAALGGGGVNMMSMRTPVLPQKRPAVTPVQQQQEEYFRRNYAAVAAAAAREEESEEEEAAAAEEEQEEEEDDEEEGEAADEEPDDRDGDGDGIRKLARVIEKFGQVYARVEKEKQRQLIELEKQRMQFAKELECQRMQMLVEMQVQLEKIKRAKRSNSDDMYS